MGPATRFLLTILALYIAPVLLISTDTIPRTWRFGVLIAVTLLAWTLSYLRRYGREALGFRCYAGSQPAVWALASSAILLLPASAMGLSRRLPSVPPFWFFVFFVLISAPAQEFLYRSFLFAQMKERNLRPVTRIVVSAGLFAFMHVVYRDGLTVAMTFLAGLVWATAYHRTGSFAVVAFSHAAVGAVAMHLRMI